MPRQFSLIYWEYWKQRLIGMILAAIATFVVINPAFLVSASRFLGVDLWVAPHQFVGKGEGFQLLALG